MAFMVRRFFSSSAPRLSMRNLAKSTVATPAPLGQGALLETAELQQLTQKAKGPWSDLSKQDVVQCEFNCVLPLLSRSVPVYIYINGREGGLYSN